jgi:hypothetical protein
METLVLTASLMGIAMVAMAVGVIFSNKALKGSCGGAGGNCPCAEAGTPGACKTDGGPPSQMTGRKGDDGVMIYE